MTMRQLTFDGREVPLQATRVRLGLRQKAVMRQLGLHGSITSTGAGVIVHGERGRCGFGARDVSSTGHEYAGAGCCRYAGTDGSALMLSLERLGLVEKIGGVWYRANDDGADR